LTFFFEIFVLRFLPLAEACRFAGVGEGLSTWRLRCFPFGLDGDWMRTSLTL
jgi:hypothetical protein